MTKQQIMDELVILGWNFDENLSTILSKTKEDGVIIAYITLGEYSANKVKITKTGMYLSEPSSTMSAREMVLIGEYADALQEEYNDNKVFSNLIDHDVVFLNKDTHEILFTVPRAEIPIEDNYTLKEIGSIKGIAVYTDEYGRILELPESSTYSTFLVTEEVARSENRTDFLVPSDQVVTENGEILGYTSLKSFFREEK